MYLITPDPADLATALEAWEWIGLEDMTPVAVTAFGDVFLVALSGIWFMERYEIQILDAYDNPTYADGTVGAIYAWKPPLVNPSRRPGEWQSYDIVFERPRFGPEQKSSRPLHG